MALRYGILTVLIALTATGASAQQLAPSPTLDAIKARGNLECGVHLGLPGFSFANDKGEWSGIDVDYCRALAAAVLSPQLVFSFLVNASGAIMLVIYLLIAFGQIRMRSRLEKVAPDRLSIRMWFHPWGSIVAIVGMVAVLIANPNQEARTRELPPNPDFADFLNNELMPWIRENYHVSTDPRQVVVAGSSFGGIASVYAGLRHSETFGNILCQSGSFWWSAPKPEPYTEPNFLAKEFVKSPKLPLRFYMDAGSFEVDMDGLGGSILEPSRHMRDVLLAKGYEVHYQESVGGHDYLSWRGTLADGLIALLGIDN